MRSRYRLTVCFLLLLSGCTVLKQCAYEGIGRDGWQQPEKVVAALQLRPGNLVADLGSGGGYFTFRLAQAVGPQGTVYAVDIDQDMLGLVKKKAREHGANNVVAARANEDDPALPAQVDLIFTVNTFHHFNNRVEYLRRLRRYLRPSGRIAIIDFDRRSWFAGLWRHYTPSEFIKGEMAQAGYSLAQEFNFLDRQSFLIFTPAAQDVGVSK